MEKDCTTCKYGFVDEQFGFPMCHHPKRFSEDCVDFNMHEEMEKTTEQKEEKKLPEGLEEAAENYVKDWTTIHAYEIEQAFIAGAEWQKEKMMEKAVEGCVTFNVDLEEEGLPSVTVIADEKPMEFYKKRGFKLGDKVRVIIIKEDEK